jgi:hypothetical protein
MTDDTNKPNPVDPPTTDTFVDRISSRHFIQAFFVQITGAAALFLKIIDGGTYVALSSLALSIYGAASITDKRLNGPDYDPTRHDR